MKQYVIDDLRAPEMERLFAWCSANLAKSCFNDVFWLNLDESVLNATQKAHNECRPFYVSVFLDYDAGRLVVDLVARTARSMHCECAGFLEPAQLVWLDNFVSAVFNSLNIRL